MSVQSLFFFDRDELVERATRHAAEYQSATPFPHIVLENFLPADVAEMCEQEFPGSADIAWGVYTDNGRTQKLAASSEAIMPPRIRQVVNQFNSRAIVEFLEKLTGITGLIPDPYLMGGGLHRIERGGFLDIHADFNRHPLLNVDRRLNLLVYLNPDWQEDWGGHLELWDTSMSRCERLISPRFNRCVIFNTTDTSFHGHPQPLACPPDVARRSFAFYYYSNGRPEGERSGVHSTLYQVAGGRSSSPSASDGVRAMVSRRLPPSVKEKLRSMRNTGRTLGSRARDETGSGGGAEVAGAAASDNHWSRVNRIFLETVETGAVERPNYLWSLLHAANVARTLKYERITAIEFGVAGGRGLLALERAADTVEQRLGVTVEVVGFDHGKGLPPPMDYRDAPYLMQTGQFAMDEPKLRSRLRTASLHVGLVRDTLCSFVESNPAPIGFVSLDLDFYSSTMDALKLFEGPPERFLPRVLCYCDDVLGYPWGDSNGERRAVIDFNNSHNDRVIDHLPGLRYRVPASEFEARWVESMFLVHVLDHPRYFDDEGTALVTRLDLD